MSALGDLISKKHRMADFGAPLCSNAFSVFQESGNCRILQHGRARHTIRRLVFREQVKNCPADQKGPCHLRALAINQHWPVPTIRSKPSLERQGRLQSIGILQSSGIV
jgi:hypothetical protein